MIFFFCLVLHRRSAVRVLFLPALVGPILTTIFYPSLSWAGMGKAGGGGLYNIHFLCN